MTSFDLRRVALRSGDQHREQLEVELEPLLLGGQPYEPAPAQSPATLTITRAGSGTVFELDLRVSLHGPCFRCLADAELPLSLHAREYHAGSAAGGAGGARREDGRAADPGGDDELRTPYLADDLLDVSAWARDTVALALPDKILCRPDCAGLCPVCGKDLNLEPHEHVEEEPDPRWAVLREQRERLG